MASVLGINAVFHDPAAALAGTPDPGLLEITIADVRRALARLDG